VQRTLNRRVSILLRDMRREKLLAKTRGVLKNLSTSPDFGGPYGIAASSSRRTQSRLFPPQTCKPHYPAAHSADRFRSPQITFRKRRGRERVRPSERRGMRSVPCAPRCISVTGKADGYCFRSALRAKPRPRFSAGRRAFVEVLKKRFDDEAANPGRAPNRGESA